MRENERPNIGFLTCHLDNDYAFEICKGVEYAAEEADVNLTILPGMYLNASYNDPVNAKYDYQYNSIFYYANKKSLDALIISIGSVGSFLSVEDKKAFLDQFDLPILTIEAEIPGYPYLFTEGATGMRDAIEHLIKDHGKTKIGFVSGRLENADALERFNVYKKVLAENGIEYEEKKVAYGNFSEFTEELVTKLLYDNPDLEAIVFANDTMAIGGYKAIKKRGLKIGKDILVTGFDNTPTSLSLSPPLTTVDNNVMDLGYYAVYQALELIKTGETSMSLLHSKLIKRLSCGCNPTKNPEVIESLGELENLDASVLIKTFKDLFMSHYDNSFYSKQLFEELDPFFSIFTNIIYNDKTYTTEELQEATDKVLDSSIIIHYYSHNKFTYLMRLLSDFLLGLNLPAEKHVVLESTFNSILTHLAFYISNEYIQEVKDSKADVWQSMRLTRDTLLTATNDEKCFKLIAKNLHTYSDFQSAYVYLYDEMPILLNDGMWNVPKYVHLQTFCKDDSAVVLDEKTRILPSYMIFKHKYTPNERRHTMVLTPLITNEVQHGLLLCETNLENFKKVYSTSLQLGTSLKFIYLMKQELAIQSRLEQTMNEIRDKNDQLNAISVTDELTGLYNRRGFFEAVAQILSNTSNTGKPGLVGYIDMDNLKQVNDRYGHKDGDFALTSIADTLKKSFPKGTIIARIGGDEFAVFVPDMTGNKVSEIKDALDYYQNRVNEQDGKPYYIEFSLGFKELVLARKLDIEAEMIVADEELYKDKKNKRKDVTK
ncbi:diguanylate cyclase (GGDEF) domain-containing protein [Lachnospiraceae bacterium NE2001]|nr:diguanylate cyclase (GGDEF) domain-containing protein [Lachnospiraceae bacterium NE2001]